MSTHSRLRGTLNSVISCRFLPYIVGLMCVASLYAEDNTTTTFSGGATNVGNLLVAGNTGTNNLLQIIGGAKVFSSTGLVGNASSATFNSAIVSGVGSIWTSQVLSIGSTGSYNSLTISNGGRVVSGTGSFQTRVGGGIATSSNNTVVVTGTNTSWVISGDLRVGLNTGGGHQVLVADGAQVTASSGLIIGDGSASSPSGGRNIVTISGSNSLLSVGGGMILGRFSPFNQLIITNGGRLFSAGGIIGFTNPSETDNTMIVTGSNSLWRSTSDIRIQRARNVLRIEDGGSVSAPTNFITGNTGTRDNMVLISGGTFAITNAAGTGFYHLDRGSNVLNSGTLTVDSMLMTNGVNSLFVFNGGTFNTKNSTFSNVALFVVGDGSSSATLNLQGGSHQFFNGLRINTNAILKGTGTISGTSTTTVFGTISPGNSPGILTMGSLTLASNAVFDAEIAGTTPGILYDQLVVNGFVNLSNSILDLSASFAPAVTPCSAPSPGSPRTHSSTCHWPVWTPTFASATSAAPATTLS